MLYIKYMHETNIKSLDLNLLVPLEALLNESSVSKAAIAVNLSQPAMSRSLERLRHVLKDPILVRSGRGMVLTPRAESLRKPLQEALERVRGVLQPNEFIPATSQAQFRIVGVDYVSHLLMPHVLEQIYVQAPNISVSIENISLSALSELKEGTIDLGIGVIEGDDTHYSTAYHQTLFDDRFVCLMRQMHPLSKAPLTVEAFAGASHALLSITGRGKGQIDKRLVAIGLTRKISLHLSHFLAIHSVIAKTNLITTIPLRLAKQMKGEGLKVVELPPEIRSDPFTISQIWHERYHQDPARKWLRSIVKNASEDFKDDMLVE
jgi:DNA-binding transcriptional LysR family regulator